MKTKVKSVTGNGTYDSQYGIPFDQNDPDSKKVMFKYEYEMEDGVTLTANHKSYTAPFKEGDEVEYEITKQNEYGIQAKVTKPQDGNFKSNNDNLKGVKIGHAITNAVVLYCSEGNPGSAPNIKEAIKEYAKMIYNLSEELNNEL